MRPLSREVAEFVELFDPTGRRDVLILADHAGNRIPAEFDRLGLPTSELERHIAYDLGIAPLARELALRLRVPALLNHASRLIIDPNRRPDDASAIPEQVDGTIVPGNLGLDRAARRARIRRFFLPWHRAIAAWIAVRGRAGACPVLLALHSFTPCLEGRHRPWQIGVLWRGDDRLARPVLAALRARGDLLVGDNEPYSGIDAFGFTIEFHAQRTRLPHLMLEIRQDEIDTRARAEAWADRLADLLAPLLARGAELGRWQGTPPPRAWKRPIAPRASAPLPPP
ncbi:MAG: N-formylglutamate amidohydrolase [Geminicoccaceae bacterium]|nr:N-formylglutamate amidohydrolase [Geminicoccaceae bacterium]MDW8340993.1 N-formylglutamate amidohydrolase [Geminicoccaceae bacterium]